MVLAAAVPVFFFDQFLIGGSSMEPTLHDGDHVLVNKMLHGARIYKKYDFSVPEMECFRMPGFRKVKTWRYCCVQQSGCHRENRPELILEKTSLFAAKNAN